MVVFRPRRALGYPVVIGVAALQVALSSLTVANASADGWVAEMADVENGRAADDDAAAREAAEVAVELTETDGPEDKTRVAKALQAVAGIGAEAVRRGGSAARTGGGFARRGADTAAGTVVRGTGSARRGVGSAGRASSMTRTSLR